MGVDVLREGVAGVAEGVADQVERDALFEEQGRGRVAEGVEPAAGELGSIAQDNDGYSPSRPCLCSPMRAASAKTMSRCAEMFHGINVKLVKCGGLTPARRMLEEARRQGLKTMIGCMTESTVGVSAAAQLAPLVDYADLDGPLLIGEDIATGVWIERGQVLYSKENGCGVRLI